MGIMANNKTLLVHNLDTSGAYQVKLLRDADSGDLSVAIHRNPDIASTGKFEDVLLDSMEVAISGYLLGASIPGEEPEVLNLDDTTAHQVFPVKIKVGGVTLAKFLFDNRDNRVEIIFAYKLLPHEVRMITDGGVPDPRPSLKTDLHTHLSAAVPASDLVRIAIQKPVLYPVSLLERLGVEEGQDYNAADVVQVPKEEAIYTIRYYPESGDVYPRVPMNRLSEAALHKIQAAMCVPVDARVTFPMMEEVYAYRTPMTKDLSLFREMLWSVALEYQHQGVEYVEHSMTDLFNPAWIKVIHEEMPKIKKETGVDMRFLMAIPRGMKPEMIEDKIEQYKILSHSPWIAGVDLLAHEKNPTASLLPQLEQLAQWMEQNDAGATLRIHAGENPMFPDNVKDAVILADKYAIHLRIGHGLYGCDDETIALIKRVNDKAKGDTPRVIVEANMNSNMALNFSEYPMYPFLRYLEAGVPLVMGTDGGNIYHTTVGRELRHARRLGATDTHMKHVMEVEDKWIAKQQEYFARKTSLDTALNANDFDTIASHFPALKFTSVVAEEYRQQELAHKDVLVRHMVDCGMETDAELVEAAIAGKTPIFIGGAVHESWSKIPANKKTEIDRYLSWMVETLSPDEYYFVTSGTDLGITRAFYEKGAAEKGFVVLGAFTDASQVIEIGKNTASHALFVGQDWFEKGPWLARHLQNKGGEAIIASGGSVTEDEILYFYNRDVSTHLMQDVGGASSRKAKTYPRMAFDTAKALIERLGERLTSTHSDQQKPSHDERMDKSTLLS